MSSGSVRLHTTRNIHQHDDPLGESGERPVIPDCRSEGPADRDDAPAGGRLWRENGRLMYQPPDGGEAQPARVLWARPLSGRGGPVSIMMAAKKRELAYIPSLDVLSPESRAVAEEELAGSMVLARITAIERVKPRFGNYYFDVETTLGKRRFLLSAPENNSIRPSPDALIIKDVSGNCYEINPVSGLSKNSLVELDRVL